MISIKATMYQDKLIDTINLINDFDLKFIKKDGFEIQYTSSDDEKASIHIKKALKETSEFKAIYFQINII
ncbi:MAG: hypothetical protein ACK5LZ_06710 [Anaerorhabdus sp.]